MTAAVFGIADGAFAVIVAAVIAAAGGIASAVLSHKTRSENSTQHGESQRLLGEVVASVKEVTRSVGGVETAVDGLSHRIDKLDGKHDDLSEKVHRHLGEHDAGRELEED